ncbi:hypothetical protein [Cobetia sp. 1CM21F]|uniref:hypothetical protein n=1 Tax=Cobetia sp. 1CM21F TaxID=2929163 RepID=UPI0020BEDC90|nr:hypothetical protein [Cobetia sp. 1CM21F]MCK8067697.1 hypothetical protein [Cobetia sp. 1CM21F]
MAELSTTEKHATAVLDEAERVCSSKAQACHWFHNEPIDVFVHLTAEQLMSAGRADGRSAVLSAITGSRPSRLKASRIQSHAIVRLGSGVHPMFYPGYQIKYLLRFFLHEIDGAHPSKPHCLMV